MTAGFHVPYIDSARREEIIRLCRRQEIDTVRPPEEPFHSLMDVPFEGAQLMRQSSILRPPNPDTIWLPITAGDFLRGSHCHQRFIRGEDYVIITNIVIELHDFASLIGVPQCENRAF